MTTDTIDITTGTTLVDPGVTAAVATAQMEPSALQALGLTPADWGQVRALADAIVPGDARSVSEFGREVADHTSRYADQLLDQVRNSDLEEAGAKLSQVVAAARGVNMSALSDRRSKLPVVGAWIDKFKQWGGDIEQKFESTRSNIDRLVGEVQAMKTGLKTRNDGLRDMFDGVRNEHHLLGVHIAAGMLRLTEMKVDAERIRSTVSAPSDVQDLADLDSFIGKLDIRIGNLRMLQQSALQTLPQIRVLQSSNDVLIDKFDTIRDVTVPAWKRQFMLHLGLNEQRNAVELAQTIDDATNDMLKRNAQLLHRNAVETAKANQRLVIDVETLQHVQTELIATVEEVMRITGEGAQKRAQAEASIEAMRGELRNKLVHTPAISA